MSLLQMSTSGAILILAVVVIRAIAIHRLPKKTFLVLWGIVLLRLLIPFSIPSMFSVYSIFKQSTIDTILSEERAGGIISAIPQQQVQLDNAILLPTDNISPTFVWSAVWGIGMVICAAFFVMSYLRCWMEFQTSLLVQNDFCKRWLKDHSAKPPISIRQSDRISAPLTYGFFRPVILMPKKTDWTDINKLQYILTHEYVHICRRDTITKLITIFALCVHWFNPMVWVMYILINRDIELACDESVVRQFGENSKSAYSLMLINMEAKRSGLLPLCNNFSKNAIEERIIAIMKIKKTTVFSITLACLIVVGTVAVFATSAQANNNVQDAEVTGDVATESSYGNADYSIYEQYYNMHTGKGTDTSVLPEYIAVEAEMKENAFEAATVKEK